MPPAMQMSPGRRPQTITAIMGLVTLVLLSLAAGGIIIWSAQRGFDLLDSSVYYLSYKFPYDVSDLNTSYHLIGRLGFFAMGENIVAFRLLTWTLLIASGVVFQFGLLHHLQSLFPTAWADRRDRLCVHLALSLALLAGFSITPIALSYNALNAMVVLASTGLLLLGIAHLAKERTKSGLGLVGACFGLMVVGVLVKPTTGLLLCAGAPLFLALTPTVKLRDKLSVAKYLLAFGALAACVIIAIIGPKASFVRIANLAGQLKGNDYTKALISQFWRDIAFLGDRLWTDLSLWVGGVVVVGVIMLLVRPRWRQVVGLALGLPATAAWLVFAYRQGWAENGHLFHAEARVTRFYLSVIVLLGLVALISYRFAPKSAAPVNPSHGNWLHGILLFGWLALTPIAGAFGTNNPIHLNAIFHAPLWAAIVAIAGQRIATLWQRSSVTVITLAILGAFSFSQFATGTLKYPYGLNSDLSHQDTPTAIGAPATHLLLDGPTSAFISESRAILDKHGFRPGDDIFAFFNLPGLVFAVGGRSPVIPWYFGRIYANNPVEEYYMQAAGPERRNHAWIITHDEAYAFTDHFHRGGFDFPENYTEIGRLRNPLTAMDVRFWKRKDPTTPNPR